MKGIWLYIPCAQHFCELQIFWQIQVCSRGKWKVKSFLVFIELNVKVLPPLLNQVEVRGFNWSTLPIFIIVHQHFGKSMFSNKGNGATYQIVYYTPDKSICYSLYEVKWKVVTIIISYRATTILSNTKSVNFPSVVTTQYCT